MILNFTLVNREEFGKYYGVVLKFTNEQEISNVEKKVKEIEKDVKVDDAIEYDKVSNNINSTDYVVYAISIAILTGISVYIINRVSRDEK